MSELRLNGNSVPWIVIWNAEEGKNVREIQISIKIGTEGRRQAGLVVDGYRHPRQSVDRAGDQQYANQAGSSRLPQPHGG